MKFSLSRDGINSHDSEQKERMKNRLLVKHALWRNLNDIRRIFAAVERNMKSINKR